MSGMSMSMSMDTSSYSPHPAPRTPAHAQINANAPSSRLNSAASANSISSRSISKGGSGSKEKWDVEEARIDLRNATTILSDRGLKLASRWAAEHLNSLIAPLPPQPPPSSMPTSAFDKSGAASEPTGAGINTGDNDVHHLPHEELMAGGSDLEKYAKSIFDLGEYNRAATILSVSLHTQYNSDEDESSGVPMPGSAKRRVHTKGGDLTIYPPRDSLTSYGIYLRAYALYMAGERRKEEEVLELRDPLERTAMQNANIPQLLRELQEYYEKNLLDAFGLYIFGVVLKEAQKSHAPKATYNYNHHHNSSSPRSSTFRHSKAPRAEVVLIQSLIAYQFNWSAWLDLVELCISDPNIHQEVDDLLKPISFHWMYHFFCVHASIENHSNENAIIFTERLIHGNDEMSSGFFVNSTYLLSQLALAHYDMRDFDSAMEDFQFLVERDPQRLDQMDVYSNILYVKEDKVALSALAHRAMKLDKYRPETCCIVGNYYSLKAQNQKAVTYFQRALKLDRTYLSAWTLMGHEYLEMKNTAAAIEAYRRAVDISPSDYRAWYGLGQTYEILNMLLYALFYYRKAVELKPHDARMWCAMGGCYLGLERRDEAVKSYERAVINNDAEGIATLKLAMLYRQDDDDEKAARCYLRHLELRYHAQLAQSPSGNKTLESIPIQTTLFNVNVDEPEAEGLLFLAYYYRDHHEYEMAGVCCSRLLDYPGPEKEEGKALHREIQSIIDGSGEDRRKDRSFDFSP